MTLAPDYLKITQVLEGQRVRDLQDKQMILRFTMATSLADIQIFNVVISNPAKTRCYLIPCTHGATTAPIEYTFVIPAPTGGGGVWPADNTAGMLISWVVLCGTNWLTPTANAWVTGEFWGITGNVPLFVNGQYYYLSKVGLYADPYKTGIAPPWEAPNPQQELRRCQRYWHKSYAAAGFVTSATAAGRMAASCPVPMRATPTLSLTPTAPIVYDGTVTPVPTALTSNSNAHCIEATWTTTTLTATRRGRQLWSSEARFIEASARL